jgi:hypothetical protein
MATSLEWEVGTTTTVLGTELNALASGSYTAAGTAYDNTPGGANNYTDATFELAVTFGSNATIRPTMLMRRVRPIPPTIFSWGVLFAGPRQRTA